MSKDLKIYAYKSIQNCKWKLQAEAFSTVQNTWMIKQGQLSTLTNTEKLHSSGVNWVTKQVSKVSVCSLIKIVISLSAVV